MPAQHSDVESMIAALSEPIVARGPAQAQRWVMSWAPPHSVLTEVWQRP